MTDQLVSYSDEMFMSGFLQGVCDHIAVEQTGLRPGSEEVFTRSMYLQQAYQHLIIPLWQSVIEANDPREIVTRLDEMAGDGLDEKLKPQLPQVAGYAIGASCAGYTLIILGSKENALDVRSGELWMARDLPDYLYEKWEQGEDLSEEDIDWANPVCVEKRLVELSKREGKLARLRWTADEEPDDMWFIVKGPALPSTFLVPMLDLHEVRSSFPRSIAS